MASCIFCSIAEKRIESAIVYEDEETLAFHDIDPQAPTHILVVPRRHVPSVDDAGESDAEMLGRLFLAAKQVARQEGLDRAGYRLVVNNGRDALQSVDHLHMHLLGGRRMAWPPG